VWYGLSWHLTYGRSAAGPLAGWLEAPNFDARWYHGKIGRHCSPVSCIAWLGGVVVVTRKYLSAPISFFATSQRDLIFDEASERRGEFGSGCTPPPVATRSPEVPDERLCLVVENFSVEKRLLPLEVECLERRNHVVQGEIERICFGIGEGIGIVEGFLEDGSKLGIVEHRKMSFAQQGLALA